MAATDKDVPAMSIDSILRVFLAFFMISLLSATACARENTYDFTVTSKDGDILGSGRIRLPFKLGDDGKAVAGYAGKGTP